ncbi:hypothetical protein BH11PSE9_BH11PSE9_19490 [soil metagenome]
MTARTSSRTRVLGHRDALDHRDGLDHLDIVTPLSQFEASWPEISALLDEALNLPPADHAGWLASLTGEPAAHREALTALLAHRPKAGTDDFLVDGPKLNNVSDAPVTGLAEGTQIGAYRLISELGRGGMGTVWLAERADGMMNRRVALKLPRAVWGDSFAERLGREREILASLEHEHIARLYDAGVDAQGRPFLAMEFVEGEPIDAYCHTRDLTVGARLGLLLQVAAAVEHAHSRLVVHRDLKPGNILVTAEGQVRLLDFGIAKLLEGEHTTETALTQYAGRALTLDYASPEQIRGEPLGTASDVYSLAVVAYEVLAGTRPYRLKRGSAAELEEAIATLDPPRASEQADNAATRKALRGDLDAILNKALKKEAAQRYAGVEAFARDIERHLLGLPVQARPDSRSYRTKKFLSRHRLAVAAGAGIAVALIVGTGVSLWQASLARDQATMARHESRRAQAVQDFLFDIFQANSDSQNSPVKARDTSARQLLDVGTARLATQLTDAPEARAEVLGMLASMYYALDLGEQASSLERQRVGLLKQQRGPQDPEVANSLIMLADYLRSTDQRDQILPALEEARAILDAAGDRTSIRRADLLTTLAQRNQNLSYEKMKAYADEAVAVMRPHARPGTNLLSTPLTLAARARFLLGQPADAEPLYREALQGLLQLDEVPQKSLAQARDSLAECLTMQQKRDEAAQMFEQEEAGSRAAFGPDDTATLVAMSRRAALLHNMGQRAVARSKHEEALRRVLATRGADDTLYTPIVRTDYARSLLAEGQLAPALAQIGLVNRSNRIHYAGSAVLGSGLRIEANVLAAMGRTDEARALFAEGYDLFRKGGGGTMAAWRHNRFHLDEARLDLALHDPKTALARLARFAPPPETPGRVQPEEVERDILLSAAHAQSDSPEQAIASAQRAVERLKAATVDPRQPALQAEAALALGRALLQAGRAASARIPIEEAASWRRQEDDAASPGIVEAETALARCLQLLGQPAAAVAAARRAESAAVANGKLGAQFTQPLVELLAALHAPAPMLLRLQARS